MEVALLFLPLVGGYFFSQTWYTVKYKSSREDGHRLYFRSAWYATIFFIISIILRLLFLNFEWYQQAEQFICNLSSYHIKENIHYKFSLAVTALYSLILGKVSGHLLNIGSNRDLNIYKAIEDDDFERLLHKAFSLDMPISVTMDNKKVYIGFVLTTTDVDKSRRSISILPLVSGYRDDNAKLIMTTFYGEVYKEIEKDRDLDLTPEDFEIILPTSVIQSANLFDFSAYELFIKKGKKEKGA